MDGVDALASRFEGMQRELLDLLDYVKRTRDSLKSVREELPQTTHALASIEEVTEKAAHNLLALVEQAMAADEKASQHLEALDEGVRDGALREAVEGMASARDERMGILTEMMTELSFQDLTCQTMEKINRGLGEVETRIVNILDPEVAPSTPEDGAHAGSMSGLDRLEETQNGESRQALIDQLLGN
jgi:chemotaxis regulatin CheY-phosphate phosphatase CheZ